jgi:hypothetical protein
MRIGVFTDKQHQPTVREMLDAVGVARSHWEDLLNFAQGTSAVSGELKYYGKNYGWALRFRKSGRALLSMYAGRDIFTAQIVLNAQQAKEAFRLKLRKDVRLILEKAHSYPDGRWLFIPVKRASELRDVKQLLLLKMKSAP